MKVISVLSDTEGDCVFEELDREITEAEIITAIKKLVVIKFGSNLSLSSFSYIFVIFT
jgi:hypothetical protein